MKLAIWMIRKIKALFILLKLHYVFEPFSGILLTLAYLSKLSKWVSNTEMAPFNDFYSKKHNYNKRYDLYKHIIEQEKLDELYYLEFGVAEGHSFRWWVNNIKNEKSKFVGFDTFTGLPEKWGFFKQGDMTAEDKFPVVDDDRCEFKKGLFQETLPTFLKNFETDLRKVIHLDADIYSSTLFVLTMMAPYLQDGDILIFDEFNVPLHEFRAFNDFVNSYYIKTRVIGSVNNYYQMAFKVILSDDKS